MGTSTDAPAYAAAYDPADTPVYTLQYGGAAIALRPRLCPDGYVPAYVRGAIGAVFGPAAFRDGQYIDLFEDPVRCGRFFGVVFGFERTPDGSWEGPDAHGRRIRLPWTDWTEVDGGVLDEAARFFFAVWTPRIGQSPPSPWRSAILPLLRSMYPGSRSQRPSGESASLSPTAAHEPPNGSTARAAATT